MTAIDSGFAIIDVKRGRAKLRKRVEDMGDGARIPVLIRGFITGVHSRDDGISQEFSITEVDATELPG